MGDGSIYFPLSKFNFFAQKKLSCLMAGASLAPAVKFCFHSIKSFSSLYSMYGHFNAKKPRDHVNK